MALTSAPVGPLTPEEYTTLYRAYEVRLRHGMPVAHHIALLDQATALLDTPNTPAAGTTQPRTTAAPADDPDAQHARRALLAAAEQAYRQTHSGEHRGRHHYYPQSQQRSRDRRAA